MNKLGQIGAGAFALQQMLRRHQEERDQQNQPAVSSLSARPWWVDLVLLMILVTLVISLFLFVFMGWR